MIFLTPDEYERLLDRIAFYEKVAEKLADRLVERWHAEYDGSAHLHEYMGLSWEDYARWVNRS